MGCLSPINIYQLVQDFATTGSNDVDLVSDGTIFVSRRKKHDLSVVLDLVGGFNSPELYAFVVEDHIKFMSRVENKKPRFNQPLVLWIVVSNPHLLVPSAILMPVVRRDARLELFRLHLLKPGLCLRLHEVTRYLKEPQS